MGQGAGIAAVTTIKSAGRIGTMKSKVGDWKDLFWETAYDQQGD
jgi:hypothetical protein